MVDRSAWDRVRLVVMIAVLAAVVCMQAGAASAYELLLNRWQSDGQFGPHDGIPDAVFNFNGGDLASFTTSGTVTESGGYIHLASPGVHNARFNLDSSTLISPPFFDNDFTYTLEAYFSAPTLNPDEFVGESLDSGLDAIAGAELLTVAVVRLGAGAAAFFARPPGYYFFQVYSDGPQTLTDITGFSPAAITGDIGLRITYDHLLGTVTTAVSLDGGASFQSVGPARPFFAVDLDARALAGGGVLFPTSSPEGPFGSASCTDGVDNDGDSFTDAADSGCAPPIEGPQGAPSCSDTLDNDGDQLVDAADPGCQVATLPETCNGVDDDGNSQVDEGFPDGDADGVADCVDQDRDNDGVNDGADNCVTVANPDQSDSDSDGLGDLCDANTPPIVNLPTAIPVAIDGQFGPPTGEWVDVTPAVFFNGQSRVYTTTNPVEGAILLMYDFAWSTVPLAVGEEAGDVAFQVGSSFFNVFFIQGGANSGHGSWPASSDGGAGDAVRILVNGLPFDNSAGCIEGAVDFNSTSLAFPSVAHNLFELKVKLTGSPGGCYSPEPAFWSAVLPGVQPVELSRDARTVPAPQSFAIAASFVDVTEDGSTRVTALVEGPAGDPSCSDGLDNDGDEQIDAADPDCVHHLCAAGAQSGCRTALKSQLLIKNDSDDGKDQLLWKWMKGAATDPDDFGDPTDDTATSICIYTGPTDTLLAAADVPASATAWQAMSGKGYKYSDSAALRGGVRKALFKAGAAGKPKLLVKGKGANLPDPTLGTLPLPIRVQLVNSTTGTCFESLFDGDDVVDNAADQLKLKTQ